MNTYQTTTVQGFLPIITKLLFYGLHLVTRQGGNRAYGTQIFPVAFNQVLGVYGTRNNGGYEQTIIVSKITTTDFYIEDRGEGSNTNRSHTFYWLALGN